jgi:hypothetical protein
MGLRQSLLNKKLSRDMKEMAKYVKVNIAVTYNDWSGQGILKGEVSPVTSSLTGLESAA